MTSLTPPIRTRSVQLPKGVGPQLIRVLSWRPGLMASLVLGLILLDLGLWLVPVAPVREMAPLSLANLPDALSQQRPEPSLDHEVLKNRPLFSPGRRLLTAPSAAILEEPADPPSPDRSLINALDLVGTVEGGRIVILLRRDGGLVDVLEPGGHIGPWRFVGLEEGRARFAAQGETLFIDLLSSDPSAEGP